MQVLMRSLEIRFGGEIRDVDDQGIAFPMAARISKPLADIRRKMRLGGDGNRAREALPLPHIVEDRDRSGRLHDTTVTSTELSSKVRQEAPMQRSPRLRSSGPSERFTAAVR